MLNRQIKRYAQNRLSFLASFHWRAMLAKVTLRQLVQVTHVIAEWKSRHTTCRSRPFAFRIEPSTACNLRCPLCSTTYRTFDHGQPSQMTLELFKTIHDKIKGYAWRITFYMQGEPMMNPHLFDMVEVSTRAGHVFTSFSTNFTLMRERLLWPLFNSRLDWISISLDGFRQSTYEQYRVNGKVKDVLDGIAMTMRFKKENKFTHPYMQVNTITFSHIDGEEVSKLRAFCADCGVDMFRLRPDETGMLGPYDPTIKRKPASSCHWPWTSMSVDVDGSVYACPIGLEQGISYGSLATSSVDEIWNNDLYVATRDYLSRKGDDRTGLPKLPCYDCRWYGKCAPVTDDLAIRKERLLRSERLSKTANTGEGVR
jgi:radical SAM protein with 4Fe4S-binding SPASM domain